MTFKNIIIAASLALTVAAAAFAEEPKNAPAAGAAPAATAPTPAAAPAMAAPGAATPAPAAAPAPVEKKKVTLKANKVITLSMFAVIIGITMGVVVWAARQTKSAADFYAAGGGITGTQNGWAIAGDYMSAASFLGISGLISLYGYDGFMYSVGWLVAYITVLLIVAEPCRNAGKYTLGDILSFRTDPKPVRAFAAISTVAVSTFYLTAQMVGAGKLMALLVGVSYKQSIIGVGILMVGYVVFGGMTATTWVQIIKAGLLMSGALLLSFLVMAKAGFNPITFFEQIVNSPDIQDHVAKLLIKDGKTGADLLTGVDAGQRFLEPGLYLKNPLDQISLGMALVLGTAGMPHILMRFFTVPTAQAARKSVIIAMFIIGGFYVLTTLLGFGAAINLTPQGIISVDPGGNMATLILAQTLGAEIAPILGDIFLAFLCSVAFATILAVVSGLVLAASAAIAHDIYVNVIKDGHADQHEQVMAARLTSLVVGAVGIMIGLLAEKANVAHLVALAFAVASSGNLPVVVLSLFWRKFNTAGVISGLLVGTIASIGLVMVSPNMTYPKLVAKGAEKVIVAMEKKQAAGQTLTEKDTKALEKAKVDVLGKDGKSMMGLSEPILTLKNPGIISIPLGFIAAILGCLMFPSKRAEEMFDEVYVRQNTGLGMAKAVDH